MNNLEDIAYKLWATAQLLPNEGIEDTADRLIETLKNSNLLKEQNEQL